MNAMIKGNKGRTPLALQKRYGANNLDAWTPEFWANMSLSIATEKFFAPGLVHRDFENEVAVKGDKVKTRRPNEFNVNNKTDDTDVTIQDLTATNVDVNLDQHLEVTFKIRDEEWSKGLPQLIETHMKPAVDALSRRADKIIFGQWPQFLVNGIGNMGGGTSSNIKEYLVYLGQRMNDTKAPDAGRNLILNNWAQSLILLPELAVSADKRGDTQGYKDAMIGRLLGFDCMRSNNMATVLQGNTVVGPAAINLAAGYGVGSTTFVIDNNAGDVFTDGMWITIDGLPNIVVSSTTTALVVRFPLTRFVANDAVIVGYTPGAVNFASGYSAGYHNTIVVNTFTVAPQVGQAVTFGTGTPSTTPIYTIMEVSGLVGIKLDRPLEAGVAHTDAVNISPAGGASLAFQKNAIAFVQRPLNLPPSNLGVRAAVASANNMSIRVLMQYFMTGQYTLVTMDMLAGVKVLDTNYGAVLLT
jgi:hypothetical protein